MKLIFPLLLSLGTLLACGRPEPPAAPETAPAASPAPAAPTTPASTASADTAAVLNALIRVRFPKLQVAQFKAGDITADGRPDLIVVAEQPCADDEGAGTESKCRTVLLVVNEGFPKLRIAATNDALVECSDCGGAGVGDPFQGIVIKHNYFSVESLYGACDKTQFVVTFHYNRARRDWLLHRFGRVDYSCQDTTGNEVEETLEAAPDYGKVRFADFRGGY